MFRTTWIANGAVAWGVLWLTTRRALQLLVYLHTQRGRAPTTAANCPLPRHNTLSYWGGGMVNGLHYNHNLKNVIVSSAAEVFQYYAVILIPQTSHPFTNLMSFSSTDTVAGLIELTNWTPAVIYMHLIENIWSDVKQIRYKTRPNSSSRNKRCFLDPCVRDFRRHAKMTAMCGWSSRMQKDARSWKQLLQGPTFHIQ